MNKKLNWKIILGIAMIILSVVVYVIHFVIFRDAHHIFIYLLGDIAFVFIEVLLVTLIIHHLLNEWEKRSHLKKLNIYQWLSYMQYTKEHYPYFFLFAMRTNPFDEKASWLDNVWA